ncbi:cytochrome P450 [Trametes punicea]|nr:cytochrome P450 [Trametes punicea]
MLSFTIVLACLLGALVLRVLWRSVLSVYFSPLCALRGPPSPNPFYGHARQICRAGHWTTTQQWMQQFGNNLLCRWLLMIPCLWTADPQVIRHVLHSSNYAKPWEARISAARVIGESVLVAQGEKHQGQRTILNPAFGAAQIKELVHIFLDKSAQLRDLWADEIAAQGGSARLDALDGLKKMTLDVIGLAGFDYHLEALNATGKPNELNQAFYRIFLAVPRLSIYRIFVDYLPFLDFFPNKRTKAVEDAHVVMRRIGLQLIEDKKAAIKRELADKTGTIDKKHLPGKDLLTLLIKANMATNIPDNQRLSDEEVLAQIPTFLVAGHETTSIAAAWFLFALTQNRRVQEKLREELLAVETESPTMDELNALPYLDCVLREMMRLYAPVTLTLRTAKENDVIPTSEPFVDRYGKLQHEIRIAKGNRVMISIFELHHSKAIWGDDALEFRHVDIMLFASHKRCVNQATHTSSRPERWENPPEELSNIPGVWGHMLTFSAGTHACIGYRFSLGELKALMFTLLRAFEFELPVDPKDITTIGMFTQKPALRTELSKGGQMPLVIRRTCVPRALEGRTTLGWP